MTVTRGHKGKYFTDVIRKKPISARIQTIHNLIEGVIHIHPDNRPLDELIETPGFLAVTDVIIHLDGEVFTSDFIAVNTSQIIWVQPIDESDPDHD